MSDSRHLLDVAMEEVDSGAYDSALTKLNEIVSSEPDSSEIHIQALSYMGEAYREKGLYEQSRKALEKAERLGIEYGFKIATAKAIRLLGNTLHDMGLMAQAEEQYQRALTVFQEAGDFLGVARCLNNLGVVRADRGDLPSALELYERSLKIHTELNDSFGIGACLNNIGEIHRLRGDYGQAEDLYRRSLQGDRKRGDKYGQAICWGNLGAVALARKDFKRAETRTQRAVDILDELDTRDLAYVEMRGLMVGLMSATGRFDQAHLHLDEIWSAAEALNSDNADMICEFYSGVLAQRQLNLSFARTHFNNCLELAKRGSTFEYVLFSLIQLVELELLHYRLTLEDTYLKAMKQDLDQALELAEQHKLYGALLELLILQGLFNVENQEFAKGFDDLLAARRLCEEKGFVARRMSVDQQIDKIRARMDSSQEHAPETIEQKMRRFQDYIEDCERIVLASR